MDFKRKDTGGFWRRPFVATMLPLITAGDIFVMVRKETEHDRFEYRHLYTIWDMSGDRKRPFEVARLDQAAANPGFAEPVAVEKTPVAQPDEPVVQNPVVENTPVKPASPAAVSESSNKPVIASAPVDTSPDAVKPPKKDPATIPAATVKTPSFEEDPLFGTEFDITF
jgi:hypothetical protein